MRFTLTLILLIGFLLAISAATAIYTIRHGSLLFAAICALSVASAVLLVLRKRFARYPFFVVAGLIAFWWSWTILGIIDEGWPHMDPLSSAISLVPGLLLISVCIFGSVYVYRVSRPPRA